MKIVHVCLGIVIGLLATPGLSPAQPVDAPNIAGDENMPWNRGVTEPTRATAREAFLEGNRLFRIPLFSRAVDKYNEALESWKHPAFYFNLALAQINLGQYLDARDSLERALKHGPAPLRADRFEEGKKQLVEVERHLGRIRVSCPTPGAEVTLDGATLFIGPGDREVWVTGRTHQVTAKKSDYVTQARRVTVAPGARERLDLSLRKLIEDRPWAAWKPWAVVGAGVVIAGVGGAVHTLAANDFNAYDTGFPKLTCAAMGCTEAQIDAEDRQLSPRLRRAQLEQKIAVAGYVAGGAVIALGTALVYWNRPRLTRGEETNPNGSGIAVTPLVSSDTAGVLVTVRR
jgi:tetratricopeptide (TPR) repeat protein